MSTGLPQNAQDLRSSFPAGDDDSPSDVGTRSARPGGAGAFGADHPSGPLPIGRPRPEPRGRLGRGRSRDADLASWADAAPGDGDYDWIRYLGEAGPAQQSPSRRAGGPDTTASPRGGPRHGQGPGQAADADPDRKQRQGWVARHRTPRADLAEDPLGSSPRAVTAGGSAGLSPRAGATSDPFGESPRPGLTGGVAGLSPRGSTAEDPFGSSGTAGHAGGLSARAGTADAPTRRPGPAPDVQRRAGGAQSSDIGPAGTGSWATDQPHSRAAGPRQASRPGTARHASPWRTEDPDESPDRLDGRRHRPAADGPQRGSVQQSPMPSRSREWQTERPEDDRAAGRWQPPAAPLVAGPGRAGRRSGADLTRQATDAGSGSIDGTRPGSGRGRRAGPASAGAAASGYVTSPASSPGRQPSGPAKHGGKLRLGRKARSQRDGSRQEAALQDGQAAGQARDRTIADAAPVAFAQQTAPVLPAPVAPDRTMGLGRTGQLIAPQTPRAAPPARPVPTGQRSAAARSVAVGQPVAPARSAPAGQPSDPTRPAPQSVRSSTKTQPAPAALPAPSEPGRAARKGRSRSRARILRPVPVVAAVAVVGAGGFVGYHVLSAGSGPAHVVSTPNRLLAYVQEPALAKGMGAQQLRAEIVAKGHGEASHVVDAVYEASSKSGPLIILFIGGNLSGSASSFISSFTGMLPGSFVTSPGSLGGQAACVPSVSGRPAECAWADDDTFGLIASPDLGATALGNELRQIRPLVEHKVR